MIATDPRPEWTYNNPGAYIYWMKTGASELPADWIDDADIDDDADDDADDEPLTPAQ
jgi:hypothetical protein